MTILRIINNIFILIFMLNGGVSANCLLPEANSFSEFVEKIEQREGWENSVTRHATRLSRYKHKSKIDSLFEFANRYFEERLPREIICSQIDVRDRAWFSFYDYRIVMIYAFYLDPNQTGVYDEKITINFTYTISSNTISVRSQNRNFWIPNCLKYPDSCRFDVTSKRQSIQIAKDLGFIEDDSHANSIGSSKAPPFYFEIPKEIDDDCGMQSLYINSYNKDTILSPVYKKYNCATWQDKIEKSDLVIDGTVIDKSAFSLNGDIYTIVRIEVHHLFKGNPANNYVTAISLGGDLYGRSLLLSHGQIDIGAVKRRYIFFLHRKEQFLDKLQSCDKLLGEQVYLGASNAFALINVRVPEEKKLKSTEEQFQRIEKITGNKRKSILHPQTFNKEMLAERRTIPDREPGVAAFLSINKYSSSNDTIGLYINLAGTNDFIYLDNWEIELSYDSLAFGTWIVKKGKIDFSKHSYIPKELSEYYNCTITDKSATSVLYKWDRKQHQSDFIELPVANSSEFHGILLSMMKIAVSDVTQPMNLKLNFSKAPIAHDYQSNKDYKIEYQYTSKPIKDPLEYFRQPVIDNFYPKEGKVGDTITVEGKYFTNSTLMLFGKSYSNRRAYKSVHRQFIVSQSDNKVVFIIPPFMQERFKKDESYNTEAYVPISKHIFLIKPNAHKGGARTKEELIIK